MDKMHGYHPAWARDPRSIGLLALAAFYIRIVVLYSPIGQYEPRRFPTGLTHVQELFPLWWLSTLWALSAALLVYVAVTRVRNRWIFAATVFMPVLWGSLYWGSFILAGFQSSDWSTAIAYWLMAVIQISLLLTDRRL